MVTCGKTGVDAVCLHQDLVTERDGDGDIDREGKGPSRLFLPALDNNVTARLDESLLLFFPDERLWYEREPLTDTFPGSPVIVRSGLILAWSSGRFTASKRSPFNVPSKVVIFPIECTIVPLAFIEPSPEWTTKEDRLSGCR